MSKHVSTKIILCNSCKGDGIHELKKKGYPNYDKCPSCKGTGRQYETTTIEWKPYKD